MSKEIQQIINKVAQLGNEDAILATVVDVQGSGYRLAGARMLIDRDGASIGTVSGGCLEADVVERAKKVLDDAEPTVISYDSTKEDNSVFGLGMGCRGVVRILLEPAKRNASLDFVRGCFERRSRGVIATLISKTDDVDLPIGFKLFAPDGQRFEDNLSDPRKWLNELVPRISDDAATVIGNDRSQSKIYDPPDGELEFFIEVIDPPTSLLMFGAGHDAPPLAHIAKQLGWRVTVIDHRPAFATAERFPEADAIIVSRVEELSEDVFADEASVAVVMSHNYDSDRTALHRLLNSKCRYIGALGPKKRAENLLSELRQSGVTFDDSRLAVLHSPVGLDIGATTPETIALSIIAEIQTALAGRKGGFLRDRVGSIYDR